MIGSPLILIFDILIAMNNASIERFQPRLKKRGFSFSGRLFGDKAAEINKNSILEGIRYLENKKSRYI